MTVLWSYDNFYKNLHQFSLAQKHFYKLTSCRWEILVDKWNYLLVLYFFLHRFRDSHSLATNRFLNVHQTTSQQQNYLGPLQLKQFLIGKRGIKKLPMRANFRKIFSRNTSLSRCSMLMIWMFSVDVENSEWKAKIKCLKTGITLQRPSQATSFWYYCYSRKTRIAISMMFALMKMLVFDSAAKKKKLVKKSSFWRISI